MRRVHILATYCFFGTGLVATSKYFLHSVDIKSGCWAGKLYLLAVCSLIVEVRIAQIYCASNGLTKKLAALGECCADVYFSLFDRAVSMLRVLHSTVVWQAWISGNFWSILFLTYARHRFVRQTCVLAGLWKILIQKFAHYRRELEVVISAFMKDDFMKRRNDEKITRSVKPVAAAPNEAVGACCDIVHRDGAATRTEQYSVINDLLKRPQRLAE